MVRWQPGARERLQAAALDLYVVRGFEQTTAAEIARCAGLTERTFFRYFTDKREVLFDGQGDLAERFTDGVASAPEGSTPLELVTAALDTSAVFFPDDRRAYSRLRQEVIDAHDALRERELLKLAALATVLGGALRDRGVAEPAATLAAETAVTVFKVAFGQWIADDEERSLAELEHRVLRELTAVAVAPADVRPTGGRG